MSYSGESGESDNFQFVNVNMIETVANFDINFIPHITDTMILTHNFSFLALASPIFQTRSLFKLK